MELSIRKVSFDDGPDIYHFLQQLPYDENGFINSVAEKTYEEYRVWLQGTVEASRQTGLIDGWKVPQTVYWLYCDAQPIGYGKVRRFLTDSLREAGGHIGISIHPDYRGRGYGKGFLTLLMEACRRLGMDELYCTVKNENGASIQMALSCGGSLDRVSDQRHYITIKL